MSYSPLLDQLIQVLQRLPGVGPKSARRMAFHLMLDHGRMTAQSLVQALQQASAEIAHCEHCNTFSETSLCRICTNLKRDKSVVCIVESPADVLAFEETGSYTGLYFVLMGHLSPLDGIGPSELKLDKLKLRLHDNEVKEIILATNPTVEGEATAHYIAEFVKELNLTTTRIAHGVPMGSVLEFIDTGTLMQALNSRRRIV